MHANSWNQTIQLKWLNEFMNTAVSIEIDVTNRSFHDHFIVLSQSLLKNSRFYSSYVTFSQLVTWIDWSGREYVGSSHVKCDPLYCFTKQQSFKVIIWSDSVRAWNLVKITFFGIHGFTPHMIHLISLSHELIEEEGNRLDHHMWSVIQYIALRHHSHSRW